MTASASLPLNKFNQLVQDCQDEAFTLAFSLVGDELLACQILEDVLMQIFMDQENGLHPMNLQVLKEVVSLSRQMNQSQFGDAITIPGWKQLERCQQEALLLVDVLGKSYPEAAFVLHCSWRELVQNVALGRCFLSMSSHSEITHNV